ncbi:acyltransferase [Agreia sp. Leaf283]|uniref:acyltransferase family protein n=1 Tax=Agreia sp. Leaf283 TaxID=1736321 RepID=UPI00072B702A|nr:acyltransferase [Agreia sp. Leaf283]KQP56672.1 hypothetical protein ASF51_01770 [Agreia sp. Leaf283]
MGENYNARPVLKTLTGLRFVAAFVVVGYHLSRYLLPEIQPFAGLGYVGVTFFFVLSGFLLTWSFKQGDAKRRFYWKRFARIYPLFLLTTILAGALILARGQTLPLIKLPPVLLMIQSWIPPGDWHYAYNGVSWSLSDEAFFYLLFPLVVPLILRQSLSTLARLSAILIVLMVAVAVAVIAILPEQTWGALLYVNPAYRFGEFLLGVIAGCAFARGWRPQFGFPVGAAIAVVCLIIDYAVALLVFPRVLDMPFAIGDLIILPGVVAIVIGAASTDVAGKRTWLASKPFVKLGEWSFALYLIHELVIKLIVHLLPGEDLGARLIGAIVAIAASLALAGLLYTFFERPVEKKLRGLVGSGPRQAMKVERQKR